MLNMQFPSDNQESEKKIWTLAQELYPIHRTLVNDGFKKSLEIISDVIPIQIQSYPSGKQFWDWTIPNAWDVNEAYIKDSKGNTLVDFKDNNLHLSQYSINFSGMVSHEDLLQHIQYLKHLPDAIPFNYLYYRKDWQFNIPYNWLSRFTDDSYYVHIDVNDRPDFLRIGELVIPGKTTDEVLFSTYLCHPSMANDNLSGVLTLVELFRNLLQNQEQLHYTYRLVILPETIGSIVYLASHEELIGRIIAGYSVYDCGDKGGITYKKSYYYSLSDRLAEHVLKHYCERYKVIGWDPRGSDERQYNAPGVRLPIGSVMRSPAAEYLEYHTSLDDLSNISAAQLQETSNMLYKIIIALEMNRTYVNLYRGEPFFSKYDIEYPSYHDDHHEKASRSKYYVKILALELDGENSLLDISDKWNIPIHHLYKLVLEFEKAGLVEDKPTNMNLQENRKEQNKIVNLE